MSVKYSRLNLILGVHKEEKAREMRSFDMKLMKVIYINIVSLSQLSIFPQHFF